jgi:hypothetical protein
LGLEKILIRITSIMEAGGIFGGSFAAEGGTILAEAAFSGGRSWAAAEPTPGDQDV